MAAHQAPPSLGFSRQEHWSGLLFPSPMHESEKWKWSCSVMSDPQRPHGLQPTRLLCPWDFPGKSTGVGCHCLLCCLMETFTNWTNAELSLPVWQEGQPSALRIWMMGLSFRLVLEIKLLLWISKLQSEERRTVGLSGWYGNYLQILSPKCPSLEATKYFLWFGQY